nr:hypothetical protein [Tanacetum cinerariifolium]
KRLSNLEYRDEVKIAELTKNFNEQWAYLSTHPSKRLTSFCYDDDEDEDYTSAITPDEPVLSTEEPDNSLSMGDEHLDTIPATVDEASPPDSELVSSEVMEIVIPEVEGIDDDIFLTIKDDILREKLLNVNLLIAKIEALNANPTPSSDCKTKSSSTSLNSLLEETDTFDNSLPEFDTFCFDVEEISSGGTTTLPDISLPEYEVFYDDHDISPTKETQVLNTLPTHPTLQLNMKFQPSSDSLFTYVVWIFLHFLVYSVDPHYLLSLRNEDAIFDPGICHSRFSRSDISHRCGTVKKFNTHRSHLNECPMMINGKNTHILDVPLFYFYPLDQLKYGGNLV